MATVLITGSGGQLGHELVEATWPSGTRLIGRTRAELDVTDAAAVRAAFAELSPALVINTASYNRVDLAEEERDAALAVNHRGCVHLADACHAAEVPLFHLSTDYVFDGRKGAPYGEDDAPHPLGAYGESKLAGERAVAERLARHLTVRTSWLFGTHGGNFVKTMLRLGAERDELRIVDDQQGCPTPARALATMLAVVGGRALRGESVPWGLYHYTGRGETSWYGFAVEIFARANRLGARVPRVVPITTDQYPTAARRPPYSVLDCAKAERELGVAPPDWRDGLQRVLEQLVRRTGGES